MNAREFISVTVALCLGLAAVGGFFGAIHTCKVQPGNCLDAWKSAGVGALAAATTGGTLLAQLDSRKRDIERPEDPPQGDGGRD